MKRKAVNQQTDIDEGESSSAEAGSAGVKSAERAMDVLELLSLMNEPLGVSEIARRLGHPKSSISLLLNTLEARGYVVAEQGRQFRLNPVYRSEERSWVGGSYAQLLRVAMPLMRKLVDTVGESSMLGMFTSDYETQYIAKIITPKELRCDPDIGVPRPTVLTSAGLVLLAFQPQETIEKFLLRTTFPKGADGKIITAASLFEKLETIRRDGYAFNRSVLMEGASGVAAPIFSAGNQIIAAVNVVAPTHRFDKNRDYIRDEVASVAEAITRLITPGTSKRSRSANPS
ncbi:MAG: IclR family transcriptional regulator [Burkholderiaceae bacterium]